MPHESRFPDPRDAGPDGLIAIGGALEPDWLLDSYRHGIFPWPSSDEEPIPWCSPDPRAHLPLDGFHISRRLARRLRSGRFRFTCDQDFEGVLRGCSSAGDRQEGTWLTPNMQAAYARMHRLGHAHSVETWIDEPGGPRLVGGVYGVSVGGVFSAESMFHDDTDASKAALAALVAHLRSRGYGLLDIQQWTDHTGSLGAEEIDRNDYLGLLAKLVDSPITFGEQLEGVDSLVERD